MKVVYLYDNGTWGADNNVNYRGSKVVKIIDLSKLKENFERPSMCSDTIRYEHGAYYRQGSKVFVTMDKGASALPVGFDYDYSTIKVIDYSEYSDKFTVSIVVKGWTDYAGLGIFKAPKGTYVVKGTLKFSDGTTADVEFEVKD